MSKERKHYAAEEEVANLHRHLLDKVPVSDLCEELRLQPTVLALAERVFRERDSCLTSDGVRVLPGGRETEAGRVPGEDAADQRRSSGGADAEHVAFRKAF